MSYRLAGLLLGVILCAGSISFNLTYRGLIMNIWEFHRMLGFKAVSTGGYCGVFSTGSFGALEDYSAGILEVEVRIVTYSDGIFPRITINTIDDGGWCATTPSHMLKEEAENLIEDIVKKWPWKTKLPKEEDINNYLMSFGLWGQREG